MSEYSSSYYRFSTEQMSSLIHTAAVRAHNLPEQLYKDTKETCLYPKSVHDKVSQDEMEYGYWQNADKELVKDTVIYIQKKFVARNQDVTNAVLGNTNPPQLELTS